MISVIIYWWHDIWCIYVRWANRAKSIKNKPKINEDPKDALLREFQEEIARLKAHLDNKGGGGGGGKKRRRKKTKRGPDGMEIYEIITIHMYITWQVMENHGVSLQPVWEMLGSWYIGYRFKRQLSTFTGR